MGKSPKGEVISKQKGLTVTRRSDIQKASYQAELNFDGKRVRRSFSQPEEAQLWGIESLGKLKRGEALELGGRSEQAAAVKSDKPFTVQELYDWVKSTRWDPQDSPASAACGRLVVKVLGAGTPIKAVTHQDLGKLIQHERDKGAAVGTINRKLSAYNVMFDEAVELGIIDKAPRRSLFKEAEGRIRRFTPDEEAAMIRFFELARNQDMVDFIKISIQTGMRASEVLGLDDVTTSDATFVKVFGPTAKSKRNRAIPATEEVSAIIKRRRKANPRGALFLDLTYDRMLDRWHEAKSAFHLDEDREFTPHILRHEFCSRLADAGVSVQIIRDLAGHDAIETTMRYIHLSPTALIEAVLKLKPTTKTDENAPIRPVKDVAKKPSRDATGAIRVLSAVASA